MNSESTNSNVSEEHRNFLLQYLNSRIDVESCASIQDELKAQLFEWAEKITQNFDNASRKGAKSPSEVSGWREKVVKELIKQFIPFPYRTTKGVIRDINGNVGPSVDVVLLNPNHPYTAPENDEKLALIFAEGVEAAIEVKSDPANKAEFESAFKQSEKHMMVTRPVIRFLKSQSTKKIESIPYFVYFLKEVEDHVRAQDIINELLETYSLDQCPDFIVLHNCGIFRKIEPQNGALGGEYIFLPWGKMTIGGLLFYLNQRPAVPHMFSPIIQKYMGPFNESVKQLGAYEMAFEKYKSQQQD